jgi:8-oxo-dGTP diphosphatase
MSHTLTTLLATDCVVLDSTERVLLIRSANEPFRGSLAPPGSLVEVGEPVDDACR